MTIAKLKSIRKALAVKKAKAVESGSYVNTTVGSLNLPSEAPILVPVVSLWVKE